MSGVYIQGMEMPKGCAFCKISRRNHKKMICPFIWKREWDIHDPMAADHRLDGCPLIPVPEHGDLIERNKLYEKTAEWEAQALHLVEVTMHDEDATEWRKWSTVLTERSAFKFDVADAPTIIPAEEGEG